MAVFFIVYKSNMFYRLVDQKTGDRMPLAPVFFIFSSSII